MADINCYMMTFNCGRALIDVDDFAANLFNGLKSDLAPDLVVLSLQEIAPIGYSFLDGSFLAPYYTRFTTSLHVAVKKLFQAGINFETVLVRNVGMTALMVFARDTFVPQIGLKYTAGVGVGRWEMGNKGAVAARLKLATDDEDGGETIVTFVAAHLAPSEDAWEDRNHDWRRICEGLVFENDRGHHSSLRIPDEDSETAPLLSHSSEQSSSAAEHSLFAPLSNIFFGGDLNYRASDAAPKDNDFETWPQPTETTADSRHYGHLLEHDQLTREKSLNKTLHHLAESEINFPPTYKYAEEAQQRATQSKTKAAVGEDSIWLWAKHRVPSWCDRILYLKAAPPTVQSYTALPIQPTSDHRPVVLSFSIPHGPVKDPTGLTKQPFAIRKDRKQARAAARRYEFIVGLAAYLALTWEGEVLLGGTIIGIIGGYVALRALLES